MRAHEQDTRSVGVHSYVEHITDLVSLDSYQHDEEESEAPSEAAPISSSTLDFTVFATEYPEKLLPVLRQLRPEFQEIFMEYYVLHKPQWFIGDIHGCIQTRIWQTLRIVEKAIGGLLVLGPTPKKSKMRAALLGAGLEATEYGNLSAMIAAYAETRSYAEVAKRFNAPAPAIRKIFRPAVKNLLAAKTIEATAIGAWLRSLIHQASLRKEGISKRAIRRLNRTKVHTFVAPALENTPLLTIGDARRLHNAPWTMLELSWDGEQNLVPVRDAVQAQMKKIFGRSAAQVFLPIDGEGKPLYGYIFARSTGSVRGLLKIKGVSSIATQYHDSEDSSSADIPDARAVLVPDTDVQGMISQYQPPQPPAVHIGDFAQIMTGPAAMYCGTVTEVKKSVEVRVDFPTGRQMIISADPSSVKLLEARPEQRAFWGIIPDAALSQSE